MDWSVAAYGPGAWLVRFGRALDEETMGRALAVARELEERPPAGLREFTMGYGSVLLELEGDEESASRWGQRVLPGLIENWRALDPEGTSPGIVEIPVVYDGEDLAAVARRTGLGVDEVVARHSGRDYRVWLLGFAPGFPYLGVLDEVLHLPRRTTPRARVAAGSVAIAGAQTGIYPSESAGGWHVIGRTARTLFDPAAAEPFLLRPGNTVRFVAVGAGDV
jgi:KipI family sensor histidine kinase inhibitor